VWLPAGTDLSDPDAVYLEAKYLTIIMASGLHWVVQGQCSTWMLCLPCP
jgi:hypothetical protein